MRSFLSLTFVLASPCAFAAPAAPHRLAPDFYVFPQTEQAAAHAHASFRSPAQADTPRRRPEDCRAHIEQVLCVDPEETTDAEQSPRQAPRCAAGGEAYVAAFQSLHDQMPLALQRMFCSLTAIKVLSRFEGTAFASVSTGKDGKANGAVMGIRRSVLDEGLDLQTWASWKEQLSFGGSAGGYAVSPLLPHVRTNTAAMPGVNDFLYFVVTHEFGHMFDIAGGFNRTVKCKDEGEGCALEKGTWGSLSWATDRTPLERNRFPFRKGLCFYGCGMEGMTRAAAPDLYEGLARSEFLSTYAATNPWDDFADSLAYYLMRERLGTGYVLRTAQGREYDIMAKIDAPQFQPKRAYIEAFLARSDIAYP